MDEKQFETLVQGRIVRYVASVEERISLGLEANEFTLPALVVRISDTETNVVDLQVFPACDECITFRAEVSYHKRLMHRVLPEQERPWHWPAGRVSEEKKYDAR